MRDVRRYRLCCSSTPLPKNNNNNTSSSSRRSETHYFSWRALSCSSGGLACTLQKGRRRSRCVFTTFAVGNFLISRKIGNKYSSSSNDIPRRSIIPLVFITGEDAPQTRDSSQRQTRANMFETKGIPFVLLDLACLILGMYLNSFYSPPWTVCCFCYWYKPICDLI